MILTDSHISIRPICSYLLLKLVEFIHVKCLTECQSRLGMGKPSPRVSFWFISFIIMCLMDLRSYNKFWAVVKILGLKSALNFMDSSIDMVEKVPGCRHASLWECRYLSRRGHAHSMGASSVLID